MANITKKNIDNQFLHTAPYGNVWVNQYHYETNSAGVFVNSDTTTAVQSADVVRLGVLPAGLCIHDALIILSDVFAASTTASIGFAYCDGVDSTPAEDADYFVATLATNTTPSITRKANVAAPVTLKKDAYLTLLRGGAHDSAAGILDVIVIGSWTGSSLT